MIPARHPLLTAGALLLATLPIAATIDQDADGISDVWSGLYPSAGTALADPDDDGASNLAESVAGTNPLDPESRLESSLQFEAGFFILTWPGVLGKTYQVESSADLSSWSALPSSYLGTGAEIAAIVATAGSAGSRSFWRPTVQDLDTDDDGVSNWEETELGTDPNSQTDALIWDQRRWDRAVWE